MERQCKYARHISIYLEKNDSLDEDKLPKFPSSFEMWRPTLNTGTAHRCFLDIFKAYPILQSNMRRTRLWTHSWKFGIISESSYLENASVPNEYDPEVIQSILCEMFVYSSAEHHDKSNDKLSDSEFKIIFCQALSISVLYNQLHSLCTNSRLSPEPCSLLLFSNSTFNTEKVADHSKRPNKNLSGYSLKLATEDYDCPASSIFLYQL